MRFHDKRSLSIILLYLAVVRPGLAQEREQEKDTRISSKAADRVTRKTPDRKEQPIAPRFLTPDEGFAILGTALDSRHHHSDFSSDCSNFVHSLYERAGFQYEYASSSDLYEGTDGFRRVASPQPGDLAVWRGHLGSW
jgi:hypothetical protein